ncbi:MFS transporter [Kutzneria buriramensis]|uniref:EmrB/QacA subfamily drug resistance transporter n=1 Tax=Kutzneria buriramensis TaxID=1045776 RepID=A0A3E0GW11_9PSEU|nr:MFS transporter [Kutzneria buriramensis]REH27625.1 EmrB/QacA subfamily drug resistance transporter [Kutzneria buriramensis]
MSTSPAAAVAATPPPRRRRPGLILTALSAFQLMVVLDASVVNVALPSIRTDLAFSATGLSWVLNAYTLTFGGLLLLGGRSGDILGRKNVFLAGLTVFTVASLLAGLAPNAGVLVAARALQGIGAAIGSPTALALITTSFDGPARAKAIGVYGAVSGAGGVVGMILGGVLTQWASWRWTMFVNVPIGVFVGVLAVLFIAGAARAKGRFDIAGALLSTLGVSALTYGLIRSTSDGWTDPQTLTSLAVAVVLLAVFVAVEARITAPLMPLLLFRHRNRVSANLILLFLGGTMFGVFFFVTQFLQSIQGLDPLRAGFAFVPWGVMIFTSAQLVSPLTARLGIKPVLIIGSLSTVAATFWLTFVTPDSDYFASLFGPMILFGTGAGLLFTLVTRVGLTDVEPRFAGAASGLLNVSQRLGGSLGLAVLVAVFGAVIGGATHPSTAAALHGYHIAFEVGIVYTLFGLALALFGIKTPPRQQSGR